MTRISRKTGSLGVLLLLLCPNASPAGAGVKARPCTSEVRIKTARVTGNATASRLVRNMVTTRKSDLQTCYKQNLIRHPGEVGLLSFSVRIEPSGRVAAVQLVTSGVNGPLKQCVFKAIKGWTFSPWGQKNRLFASVALVFQLAAKPRPRALIKGGIPARLIAGTIEARLSTLDPCLGGFTKRQTLRLNIITDFDGTVQTARVTGRIRRRACRSCIIAKLKKWDFPPPDNGHRTWVWYPFQVAPDGAGGGGSK